MTSSCHEHARTDNKVFLTTKNFSKIFCYIDSHFISDMPLFLKFIQHMFTKCWLSGYWPCLISTVCDLTCNLNKAIQYFNLLIRFLLKGSCLNEIFIFMQVIHEGFQVKLIKHFLTNLPWSKWTPFRRWYSQMHFHELKLVHSDSNSVDICS